MIVQGIVTLAVVLSDKDFWGIPIVLTKSLSGFVPLGCKLGLKVAPSTEGFRKTRS